MNPLAWPRTVTVLAVSLILAGCDRTWTFTGEVKQIPLSDSAFPSCKEVREARKEVRDCLEAIQIKTDDLLALAEKPGNDARRAARMARLSAEIDELRVRAQKALPGAWETRDRTLEYRWSVDLKRLLDPFPPPHAAGERLKIRSVTVMSVQAKVGAWPSEIPFEVAPEGTGRWLQATARRIVSPGEACLDGERVFLEVEARVVSNLYGERTLRLRLKGGRP